MQVGVTMVSRKPFVVSCLSLAACLLHLKICAANLLEADLSTIGAVKLAENYFLQNRAAIVKGIGDEFLEKGNEYLQSTLLQDSTYSRLNSRGTAFLFIDHIDQNGKVLRRERAFFYATCCSCLALAGHKPALYPIKCTALLGRFSLNNNCTS